MICSQKSRYSLPLNPVLPSASLRKAQSLRAVAEARSPSWPTQFYYTLTSSSLILWTMMRIWYLLSPPRLAILPLPREQVMTFHVCQFCHRLLLPYHISPWAQRLLPRSGLESTRSAKAGQSIMITREWNVQTIPSLLFLGLNLTGNHLWDLTIRLEKNI